MPVVSLLCEFFVIMLIYAYCRTIVLWAIDWIILVFFNSGFFLVWIIQQTDKPYVLNRESHIGFEKIRSSLNATARENKLVLNQSYGSVKFKTKIINKGHLLNVYLSISYFLKISKIEYYFLYR